MEFIDRLLFLFEFQLVYIIFSVFVFIFFGLFSKVSNIDYFKFNLFFQIIVYLIIAFTGLVITKGRSVMILIFLIFLVFYLVNGNKISFNKNLYSKRSGIKVIICYFIPFVSAQIFLSLGLDLKNNDTYNMGFWDLPYYSYVSKAIEYYGIETTLPWLEIDGYSDQMTPYHYGDIYLISFIRSITSYAYNPVRQLMLMHYLIIPMLFSLSFNSIYSFCTKLYNPLAKYRAWFYILLLFISVSPKISVFGHGILMGRHLFTLPKFFALWITFPSILYFYYTRREFAALLLLCVLPIMHIGFVPTVLIFIGLGTIYSLYKRSHIKLILIHFISMAFVGGILLTYQFFSKTPSGINFPGMDTIIASFAPITFFKESALVLNLKILLPFLMAQLVFKSLRFNPFLWIIAISILLLSIAHSLLFWVPESGQVFGFPMAFLMIFFQTIVVVLLVKNEFKKVGALVVFAFIGFNVYTFATYTTKKGTLNYGYKFDYQLIFDSAKMFNKNQGFSLAVFDGSPHFIPHLPYRAFFVNGVDHFVPIYAVNESYSDLKHLNYFAENQPYLKNSYSDLCSFYSDYSVLYLLSNDSLFLASDECK